MFGWESGKVERWKTILFNWVEIWEDRKCSLYNFTLMSLVHKKHFFLIFYKNYFFFYLLQTYKLTQLIKHIAKIIIIKNMFCLIWKIKKIKKERVKERQRGRVKGKLLDTLGVS